MIHNNRRKAGCRISEIFCTGRRILQTNAKGEKDIHFYSSDLSGKFVVVLQGISKDGKTGTGVIEFEVKQ